MRMSLRMKQTKKFKSRIKEQLEKNMLAEMKHKQENFKSHMLNNHEAFYCSLFRQETENYTANFPYYNNQVCPNNGCEEVDAQEHCIDCDKIYHPEARIDNIEYSDILSNDINKQTVVTKLFTSLLERREVASANSTGPQCCPGVPGEFIDPWSKL